MHVYRYMCTYICQHTPRHTCVCIHAPSLHRPLIRREFVPEQSMALCTYVRTYECRWYVCMHACMYVCLYMYLLVCMYVAPSLRRAFIHSKFVRQQFKIVHDNFALQVWKRVIQGHLREAKKKKRYEMSSCTKFARYVYDNCVL